MRDAVSDHGPWDVVVSSSLSRCREFAQEFCDRNQLPLLVDERLQEIGFGEWEGKTADEITVEDPHRLLNFFRDPQRCRPRGAERLPDFKQRVITAWNELLEQYAVPYGFKVLAWLDSWGYRHIVLGRKISSIDDLTGLKIRTIQSNTYIESINAMGMNATPMAFGEVYSAMQTGILDGFEHNATVIKANKFYEVSKQIVLSKHLFGTVVFIYSQEEWNQFTPDEQRLIQEAADMARDIQRSLAPMREKEALGFLEDQGMEIKTIDTEDLEERTYDLQNELAEKNNCLEVLELIREISYHKNN